jgi:bifunctional DNase/RNase
MPQLLLRKIKGKIKQRKQEKEIKSVKIDDDDDNTYRSDVFFAGDSVEKVEIDDVKLVEFLD